MYQALSHFSVLQATESWAGPGNEAMSSPYCKKLKLEDIHFEFEEEQHSIQPIFSKTPDPSPLTLKFVTLNHPMMLQSFFVLQAAHLYISIPSVSFILTYLKMVFLIFCAVSQMFR